MLVDVVAVCVVHVVHGLLGRMISSRVLVSTLARFYRDTDPDRTHVAGPYWVPVFLSFWYLRGPVSSPVVVEGLFAAQMIDLGGAVV